MQGDVTALAIQKDPDGIVGVIALAAETAGALPPRGPCRHAVQVQEHVLAIGIGDMPRRLFSTLRPPQTAQRCRSRPIGMMAAVMTAAPACAEESDRAGTFYGATRFGCDRS